MANNSKRFFLLSFFPAIAYWYLEENYSIKIAAIGGLALAFGEIIFERILLKEIHKISILNFMLILFLSTLSLIADDGLWFKLQPVVTSAAMVLILIFFNLKRKAYYLK